MADIIQLHNAVKLAGIEQNIVTSVETITPESATSWLRANRNNRPVRRSHVNFLASEILAGNWQINGQAIVIAEDEQVLDGQHRLLAVIEAGQQIQSLVVYGISGDAFKTIDTSAVRSNSDALCLHYNEMPKYIVQAAANAVKWCKRLERGNLKSTKKVSNTDIIEYVNAHPSLLECASILNSYPHDARPVAISCGTACYDIFARKSQDLASEFMRKVYTGEGIDRGDVEYILRIALMKDATRTVKLPTDAKVRMMVKAWNWRRRGMPAANPNVVTIHPNDAPEVRVL